MSNPESIVNNTWKAIISVVCLLFNACVLVYLIYYGNPANSLHVSAMAWSYMASLAILAGLGIGAIASLLPVLVKK